MVANIIFYLTGMAQVWFLYHEQEITSWEVCKQRLINLFSKPIGRPRAAQKELACRPQTCTESYVTYIQDVHALCHKVDDQLPEAAGDRRRLAYAMRRSQPCCPCAKTAPLPWPLASLQNSIGADTSKWPRIYGDTSSVVSSANALACSGPQTKVAS